MTLIEGIGDEVTHFFVAVIAITIVTLAWWTTNISEQRHVRTVLLLERRRHRGHRRLTNHTEAVTITEGTPALQPAPSLEDQPSTASSASTPDISETTSLEAAVKPPEDISSGLEIDQLEDSTEGEQQTIIDTMDADAANEVRQRRLAFYNGLGGRIEEPTTSQSPQPSQQQTQPTQNASQSQDTQTVHSQAGDTSAEAGDQGDGGEGDKDGITIKLKYINDDLKMVDGKLDETLVDFVRRHFQPELSQDKTIRLIFNGQVLQPLTQTLRSCGLFHNCVVHCLVTQRKQPQAQGEPSGGSRAEGYSFQNGGGLPNLNNNNQNRDWDLGNFLFAFISFILLAAWYFRYVYAHLYTLTATVGLILITGIFTIVLVGMYFPENENIPNPTIRITRERVQVTTSQQ